MIGFIDIERANSILLTERSRDERYSGDEMLNQIQHLAYQKKSSDIE